MVRSVGTMALARIGKCYRSFVRESSKGVFCGVLQPGGPEGCIGAKRYLLSEDVIRLQTFQQKKLALARHGTGPGGNYIEMVIRKMQNNELILRDDLKFLLYSCQSTDDMVIARDAIYRYHAENSKFREYKFGPIFMRLCYELGLEDVAVATLTDQSMEGFFSDVTSFNIAIDMLFKKGSYETALDVLRTMRKQGVPFNKDTITLAFGTCYKLNTKESYTVCTTLLDEQQVKGYFTPRQAYCFAVILALQQNDIEKAKSLYSQIISIDNRACQNLKVLIHAMSGTVSDAISILAAAVRPKTPTFVRKPVFSKEVMEVLRLQTQDKADMIEVDKVVTLLEQADQVTQQTLDQMLCYTPAGNMKRIREERG